MHPPMRMRVEAPSRDLRTTGEVLEDRGVQVQRLEVHCAHQQRGDPVQGARQCVSSGKHAGRGGVGANGRETERAK
jgi:hypothetical protein